MKTMLIALATFFVAAPVLADKVPTGADTAEGIACDAFNAYVHCDSKSWLATLVKPIYGPEGNKQFEEFKKEMVDTAEKMKKDTKFKPPRIVKVFKARPFTKNGPGSAAYAFYNFHENMFVDLVLETDDGKTESLRYHVLRDADGKWWFDPRPDLSSLLSTGLNDESASMEVLYEAK